jgi:peptide/nickel transport system substrate-binding protein
VSTRDISYYRDPAVILIDQLKDIYINGELEPVETTQWYPKVMRRAEPRPTGRNFAAS